MERCHFGVVSNDLEAVQRLIAGVMREEDLVAELPLTFYSRALQRASLGPTPLAINLWYLGDLSTDLEDQMALRHINCWLIVINEENSPGAGELEELWERWQELLEELGRVAEKELLVVLGGWQNRSLVVNHVRDACLQWCVEHQDLPFLEVFLGGENKEEISDEWLALLQSCLAHVKNQH